MYFFISYLESFGVSFPRFEALPFLFLLSKVDEPRWIPLSTDGRLESRWNPLVDKLSVPTKEASDPAGLGEDDEHELLELKIPSKLLLAAESLSSKLSALYFCASLLRERKRNVNYFD
jgi:hypothetical protein